ncbi:MAG TPA: hypothetical protein VGU01_12200 [Sphingomicrobium sp.]|nr:hypothetical protein [Sphingomicrobium sp.]
MSATLGAIREVPGLATRPFLPSMLQALGSVRVPAAVESVIVGVAAVDYRRSRS